MSKSQRKGRPESHLTNRGVGVRWGLVQPEMARGWGTISAASGHRHMSNVRHDPPKFQKSVTNSD